MIAQGKESPPKWWGDLTNDTGIPAEAPPDWWSELTPGPGPQPPEPEGPAYYGIGEVLADPVGAAGQVAGGFLETAGGAMIQAERFSERYLPDWELVQFAPDILGNLGEGLKGAAPEFDPKFGLTGEVLRGSGSMVALAPMGLVGGVPGAVGVALTSVLAEGFSEYESSMAKDPGNEDKAWTRFWISAPASAIEGVSLGPVAGKIGKIFARVDKASSGGLRKTMLRAVATELPKDMLKEGGQEALQQASSILGEHLTQGEADTLSEALAALRLDPEAAKNALVNREAEIRHAALVGALAIGPFSMVASAVEQARWKASREAKLQRGVHLSPEAKAGLEEKGENPADWMMLQGEPPEAGPDRSSVEVLEFPDGTRVIKRPGAPTAAGAERPAEPVEGAGVSPGAQEGEEAAGGPSTHPTPEQIATEAETIEDEGVRGFVKGQREAGYAGPVEVVAPEEVDGSAEDASLVADRGVRIDYVQGDDVLPRPASYKQDRIILDARADAATRRKALLVHELAHHFRATFRGEATVSDLVATLEAIEPGLLENSGALYQGLLDAQGGGTLDSEALEDEATAYLFEQAPGAILRALEDPQRLRAIAEERPGIIRRIVDWILAKAAKMGRGTDPALKRLLEAVGDTPTSLEGHLGAAKAAQLGLAAADAFRALSGRGAGKAEALTPGEVTGGVAPAPEPATVPAEQADAQAAGEEVVGPAPAPTPAAPSAQEAKRQARLAKTQAKASPAGRERSAKAKQRHEERAKKHQASDAVTFIRSLGGLALWDKITGKQVGEVRGLIESEGQERPNEPGLSKLVQVKKGKGADLGSVGEAMGEAGFFPGRDSGDIDVDDVLEAITSNLQHPDSTAQADIISAEEARANQEYQDRIEVAAQEAGKTVEEFEEDVRVVSEQEFTDLGEAQDFEEDDWVPFAVAGETRFALMPRGRSRFAISKDPPGYREDEFGQVWLPGDPGYGELVPPEKRTAFPSESERLLTRSGEVLDDYFEEKKRGGNAFSNPDTAEEAALLAEHKRLRQASMDAADTRFALSPPPDSAAFKEWFGDSKAPLVFHGTGRPDRVGTRFRSKRATSGPMAFFTDAGALGSSYAEGKQDTSLEQPLDYAEWFLYKPKGARTGIPIDKAWFRMSPEERAQIGETYSRATVSDPETGGDVTPTVLPEGETAVAGADHWEFVLKREAQGNPLRAMVEVWLNSGQLFGEEHRFIDLLRLVGVDVARVENADPNQRAPAVYPVWLSIQKPLDTAAIPEGVSIALHKAGKRRRGRAGEGADQWDKRHVSGRDWLERLDGDAESGTTHAWTSIPDWVTATLKDLGYDGIKDSGGKMGGKPHAVWVPFEETQIKSATGNVGTYSATDPDIRFALALPTEKVRSAKAAVRSFAQHNLTARGNIPKDAFLALLERDFKVGEAMQEVQFASRAFRRGVKLAYGKSKMTTGQTKAVDAVFKGRAPMASLPAPLHEPVRRLRMGVDALSRRLIDVGAVDADLVPVIERNIGVYATRSYRAFDDPLWPDKVPQDVRNRAVSLIRKEIIKREKRVPTEDELEGIIKGLLTEGTAAGNITDMMRKSMAGEKNLSILKKRTGIPPEIRALLGEYEDPMINYTRSVVHMAHLIANHEFLGQVRAIGLDQGWLSLKRTSENYVTLATEGSKILEPLNVDPDTGKHVPLYTSPEIQKAFQEATETQQMPTWLKVYLNGLAAVKIGKTVGSVVTHERNIIGNIGFATAQGHWRVGKMGKAFKTVMTVAGARRVGPWKIDERKWEAYYKEALRLGLIHESAGAGEILGLVNDAANRSVPEAFDQQLTTKNLVGKSVDFLAKLYQLEDDLWKLYAWENEKARLRSVYSESEMSDDAIGRKAAEIVRNTYPTYSLVPRFVKGMRRFPITGSFVSFPAEVVRTAGNTITQIRDELKDEKTRGIGIQRLLGTIMAATGTGAAAMTSRVLLGIGADDDEDAREFMPPWSRNHDILWVGNTAGKPWYVDLGFTDPYSYLKAPLRAFMRGDDWESMIVDPVKEFLDPWAGEEILTKALRQVVSNKTDSGATVYNEAGSYSEQSREILKHIWNRAVEPGTISTLRRLEKARTGQVANSGKAYSLPIEGLNASTGFRLTELDVEQALSFHARDYKRGLGSATRLMSSVASRRGTVDDDELRDAWASMEQSRQRSFEDMQGLLSAASRLGVVRPALRNVLEGAMGEKSAKLVLAGRYGPYMPSSQFLASYARGAPRDRRLELDRRRRFLIDLAREETRRLRSK